jgi:hypothetical protein
MLGTSRDINHDNGVYYGNYKEILLNGKFLKFENGKTVDFVTWVFS